MNSPKYITFQYSARYFQLGELNNDTKEIVFVCHGYGQQAKYFIDKFKIIANDVRCVIAPEGLSKFYLEGFSGRVGATWMTKEDRLNEIENYIEYLDSLYAGIITKVPKRVKITLLGFSQGSATISRWAIRGRVSYSKLILWAGIFPPDMDFNSANKILRNKEIHYIYGTQDPFITETRLSEMSELSKRLDLSPTITTFEGKHEIDEKTLKNIFINNR